MNKTLIVYFTADRKSFQKITPSDEFGGDWKTLAEAITNSNWREGRVNYHSFQVI